MLWALNIDDHPHPLYVPTQGQFNIVTVNEETGSQEGACSRHEGRRLIARLLITPQSFASNLWAGWG